MKNEMELMKMDERQRLAWFMANRGTVIAIGAVWIAMIGWELFHERVPVFLLIMVPVFALLRAGLYFFYCSRPFVGSDSSRDPKLVRHGKAAAGFLLFAALFMPIYSVPASSGGGTEYRYAWDMVAETPAFLVPLGFAYIWTLLVLAVSRLQTKRLSGALIQFSEPVLLVVSCVILLWIPQVIFEARSLFSIYMVVVNPKPEWGCYLAVTANGIYLLSWLAGFLKPWGTQEG